VAERIWPETPWTLRPYQREALRSVAGAWADGHQRTLVVLATGLGKTTIFTEVARRRAIAGRRPTLVLAHRIELVEQAAARLEAAGLGVQIESGERRAQPYPLTDGDVVVATVQTLRGRRLESWPADYFDTVICDEAHHAAALSYRVILDRFDRALHLGVTATPDRGDAIAIGHVYPHLAFEYGIREGIEGGFLAPIRALTIGDSSLDLSSVRTTKQEHGRDLSAEDLGRAMTMDERQLHEIAAPIARESAGRQTLIFTPTVEVAHLLAATLSGYVGGAHLVRSLDGQTDKPTRAQVLDAYQRGEIRYLVNCALFTEGFDAPATSCVVVARPTKSRALYAQMVGRGTRLAPGKADCLVLDLATEGAHSLAKATDLFAGKELPDDIAEELQAAVERGEDVRQSVEEAEARAAEREARLERERAAARVTAEVRYRKRKIDILDPWAELGIDGPSAKESRGPRATMGQAEALTKAGIPNATSLSRAEASRMLDAITGRRKQGLCTIKMARSLARAGLRTDLSFAEARQALDALAANRWKPTIEIAERWGA
jgi:superfamily II DNA or RNA helicase